VEELLELRQYIQQKQYNEALDLIGEMEEMSRADKINKIYSFAKILLLHLIKQAAEKRTTRSWDLSIRNALDSIMRTNQMRKAKGFYLNQTGLQEAIHQAYQLALAGAALEVFEGRYDEAELGQLVDRVTIELQALKLIQNYHEE
jgi:hypothetical protein